MRFVNGHMEVFFKKAVYPQRKEAVSWIIGPVSADPDDWVTEWVSRQVVVTCYWVLSDLSTTCNPRFRPKNAM